MLPRLKLVFPASVSQETGIISACVPSSGYSGSICQKLYKVFNPDFSWYDIFPEYLHSYVKMQVHSVHCHFDELQTFQIVVCK